MTVVGRHPKRLVGGRLSLESRFPSFEEAIDVADEMRQRRHARGKTLAMRAIAAAVDCRCDLYWRFSGDVAVSVGA